MTIASLIQTVPQLRDSFQNKPASYRIDSRPSRTQVQKIRAKLNSKLRAHPCSIDSVGGDWRFLVLRQDQWEDHIIRIRQVHSTDAAGILAARAVPLPILQDPGTFVMDNLWTETQYLINRDNHNDARTQFNASSRLKDALVQDITDAVPRALLAQLGDDDGDFGHREPRELLDFLELKYDK